jgi:galactose oxidase-like protein/glyoxal oxidase-like protein
MRTHRLEAALTLGSVAALLLSACQDTGQSPPARPEPPAAEEPEGSQLAPIDLIYVCGNKFLATNGTRDPVQVEYRVAGTEETGGLTLDKGPGGDPGYSETELETAHAGVVELYHDDLRVARRGNEGQPCGAPAVSATFGSAGNEATVGKWSAPFPWPIIAVHLNLLPDGKVLSWGEVGQPQIWDPASKSFRVVPVATELFCSGHTFLPDGRLLVTGGHHSDLQGLPDANLFQRTTSTWSTGPKMAKGRWYPTAITLASGEVLTMGGTDLSEAVVRVPEVWTGAGWRALTGANRAVRYNYPRSFLAPNGRVFYAGESQATNYLSTSGAGSWSSVGNRLYGTRDYGAAVMYEPGKVLYAGGGRTTRTAEIIDLNQAAPVWRWTGSMAFARRHLNATILPTGQVLVTGGTGGTIHTDESRAVYAAELWDPASGKWTTLSSGSVIRGYHSTAVLLRDGRVLVTGSGDSHRATDQRNAEFFSPPYLFKGARPVISSSPSSLSYGQTFFLKTAQASAIRKVTLVRLGSTTHAFNMNQRFNRLSFVLTTGGLSVRIPTSRNLAPPGHYLLFILNGNGVPSTARIIRIV